MFLVTTVANLEGNQSPTANKMLRAMYPFKKTHPTSLSFHQVTTIMKLFVSPALVMLLVFVDVKDQISEKVTGVKFLYFRVTSSWSSPAPLRTKTGCKWNLRNTVEKRFVLQFF